MIKSILDAFPEAAGLPTFSQCYVLHLLCDYGSTPEALYHILSTRAGVSTVEKLDPTYRRRALHILNGRKNLRACQRARDSMRTLRQKIRLLQSTNAETDDTTENDICKMKSEVAEFGNDDMWKKVSYLLVAEHTQQPLTDPTLTSLEILQAAIEIEDCPCSFQEYAIMLYEECLLKPNGNHELPLHIAARRGNAGLLLDLVEAAPQAAAVRNANDELPLHLALSNHHHHHHHRARPCLWNDGIGALVGAHPAALDDLNLPDAFYPYIWSKLSSSRESLFRAIRTCSKIFSATNS